jgi:hypothetical protein
LAASVTQLNRRLNTPVPLYAKGISSENRV